MSPTDPKDPFEKYLAGGERLSGAYRDGAREVPPDRLDATILALSRHEVLSANRRHRMRWAIPFSAVATLVLAVGVITFMGEHGVTPLSEISTAVVEKKPRATAPPLREEEEIKDATKPLLRARSQSTLAERHEATTPAASAPAPAARLTIPQHEATRDDLAAKSAGEVTAMRKSGVGAPVLADVTAVRITGLPDAYRFIVTIHSADRDCSQYADWWEVVAVDGSLLYRRVLDHSHADQQPFARDGGPVPVSADSTVWVRAHMHPGGYGGVTWRGSVRDGFEPAVPAAGFGAALATQPPLPGGCGY
jgi:hypothetical protein